MRDPKRTVLAIAGLYMVFQIVTQISNPSSFTNKGTSQSNPNSPWRPQK